MLSPHRSKGHDNYHWYRGRGLKLLLILLVNCTHLSSNQLVCILSIQIKLTICPLFSLSIDIFLWKRENNNGAPHMRFLDYNLNWKKEQWSQGLANVQQVKEHQQQLQMKIITQQVLPLYTIQEYHII